MERLPRLLGRTCSSTVSSMRSSVSSSTAYRSAKISIARVPQVGILREPVSEPSLLELGRVAGVRQQAPFGSAVPALLLDRRNQAAGFPVSSVGRCASELAAAACAGAAASAEYVAPNRCAREVGSGWPSGPGNGGPMYHFRLQRTDGSPADPPTYRSSTLNGGRATRFRFSAERTLRVLSVRDDDADQPPRTGR
jgi:hypothetical protein